MRRCTIRTLMLVLGLLASMPLAATEVRAFLDRSSVHLGETVTLNVSVTDAINVAEPDFKVLMPDFVLNGTSRSQNISISNGQVSKTVLFAVALKARHTGKIAIPAFTVDGKQSQPLTLTVLPAGSQASGTPGDPVFLRVKVEPQTLYVGQQAHLSLKLYYTGGSLQGKLGDPDVAGADVQTLGKQSQYQSRQGGRIYQVVERDYSVVPRKAGELSIPPIGFRGQLMTGPNSFFGNSQLQTAQSQALSLSVRAKPTQAASPWLPARQLDLSMHGLPADGKASVGNPITVTITETASALGYEALPEPSLPTIDGAEVYPDKSQGSNDDSGQWIEGTRTRKFAIVPTRPGSLNIPAIAVDWWNVRDDKPATATIAAQTLDVSGTAVAGSALAPPTPMPTAGTRAGPVASAAANPASAPVEAPFWRRAALVALALWLLTMLIWAVLSYRRRQRRMQPADNTQPPDSAAQKRAFRQATDSADQARQLLLWARAERPEIHNLGQLATQLDDAEQARILRDMERSRYSAQSNTPDPATVHKAFAKGFAWRKADNKQDEDILPPLYPER